jgi:hypothetical protein
MNTWDAGGKCVPVDVRLEALPFTPAIAPPPAKDAALALPEWQRPFYPIVKAGKQLIGTMPGSRYPVNVEIEVTQTEGLKFKGLYQVMGRVGYLVGEMKQGGDGNGQLIIYLDVRKRITVGLYGEKLVGEMIDEKGTNLGEVTLAPRKATFPLTAPRKK